MKFAITGTTRHDRELLYSKAVAAGLMPMNSISTRSSFLLANRPESQSTKARRARELEVAVLSEDRLLDLLSSVRPGTPAQPTKAALKPHRAAVPQGPLRRCRVLVLGGPHERSAQVRDAVTAAGGRVAVNLTPTVTHFVALEQADADVRWSQVRHLLRLDPVTFAVIDTDTENNVTDTAEAVPVAVQTSLFATEVGPLEPARSPGAESDPGLLAPLSGPGQSPDLDLRVLRRGETADLPDVTNQWDLYVSWTLTEPPLELDVVAFVTDPKDKVLSDQHFVFFNALESAGGEVNLELGPSESRIALNLDELAVPGVRVIIGATLADHRTFGELGPVELTLRDPDGKPWATTVLDAGTIETSLILAEFYQRDNTWRIRAVGQGYEDTLEQFATRHGVTVDS